MCHHCALLVDEVTRLNGHVGAGAPVIVTVAFPGAGDLSGTRGQPADAALKASVRQAVAAIEETAGLRFVEVEGGAAAMISVHYNADRRGYSWAEFPEASAADPSTAGAIAMNPHYGDYAPGSGGFQVLLHEFGHAMGLKHPHDGEVRLARALDTTEHTLMSYNWRGAPKADYRPLDEAALTALYGEAGALDGLSLAWDAAADTLTVEGTRAMETILAVDDATEVFGRSGADRLAGRMADDTLRGNGGLDTVEGFDGDDRLHGGHGGDELRGGWDDDRLLGGYGNDLLGGGTGRDLVRAGPGRDTLEGGHGADTLCGDAAGDVLAGGAGADRLVGGPGADTLAGGPGPDVFVLRRNSGRDVIEDFSEREGDRINVTAFSFLPEEAVERLSISGDDVLFDIGFSVVTLAGAAAVSFDAADFIA